ncbi:MAG TPA: GAF domain-containing protein [Gemmatimonadales bacterium]|nr:GAF domain-containing protein [Gemmatimonadales bacterium]
MAEPLSGAGAPTEITWADEALRLLARAGRVLGASLDYQATLRTLTRLLVPELADACTIYLRAGDGSAQVEAAHRIPEREMALRELFARYPPDLDRGSPLGRVLATGEPLFLPEVTPEYVRAAAADAEHLRLIERQGFRSAMVVPLATPAALVGAVGVAITESDRIYDAADFALLREIAGRAALAVEHARLFEAERASRARAEHSATFAQHLLELVDALQGAQTRGAVARLVVAHGCALLGATAGFLAERVAGDAPPGDALAVLHAVGYPREILSPDRRLALTASLPVTDAVRRQAPVLLHSLAERRTSYPHLDPVQASLGPGALAAVPLLLDGAVHGAMGFSFPTERAFDEDERTRLLTLARLATQTLTRVRAVEALARREREIETLAEGLPDVVFRVDRSLRFRYVNPAVERMSNRRRAEFVGRTGGELGFPPGLVAYWEAHLREVLATGRPAELEFEFPSADGPAIYQSRLVPELGASGAVESVLGVSRDVTRERHRELARRHAQKMEAITRLAGGVAHEVNNLMTAIQGFADLLLLDAELGANARDDLLEIQSAAQRAAGLSAKLLAFGRQRAALPERTTLNALVRSASPRLQAALRRGVAFVLSLGEGLGPIEVDAAQLYDVLHELVRNANDAMPQGGELLVQTDALEVQPPRAEPHIGATLAAGRYSRLLVRDTGCGMSAETLAHALEPFYTTKSAGEAPGLGLAMAYGVVKQHGGYIWLESAPGQGTSATVLLPERAPDAEGPPAPR